MEELLVLVIQFLFEVVMNIIANAPFDWPSKNRRTPDPNPVWPTALVWWLAGSVLGWLSAKIFVHTLISIPALRVLNIFISPIASAYLSKAIATRRQKTNSNIHPRNHYWYAFWFTVGLTSVRLAYAVRF